MKTILAFSGSNHSKSINQNLVRYTASLLTDFEVTVLDISQWNIPIYSIDMDPDQTPAEIAQLIDLIRSHDGFILSSPEHNGSTPAFLKNILDWVSRRAKNIFESKPMLLMSTSPGRTGGKRNLQIMENLLPYWGVSVVATYSLPEYHQNMQNNHLEEKSFKEFNQKLNILKEAVFTGLN